MATDPAVRDEIWRQSLNREAAMNKKRDLNWGFLTAYDQKGNLKQEKKASAEEANQLPASKVPHTESSTYGSKVGSEVGQKIAALQGMTEANNRRRKADKDIVYL